MKHNQNQLFKEAVTCIVVVANVLQGYCKNYFCKQSTSKQSAKMSHSKTEEPFHPIILDLD